MSSEWLKDSFLWSFRREDQTRLLHLPHRHTTDFSGQIDRLRFQPDHRLLRNLPDMPHRPPGVRRAPATQGPSEAPLPDFPIIPDIPMHYHGDFQRVVMDALQAIWSRVSRCRCSSRRSVRARWPSAAGPSRQRRDASSEDVNKTGKDTD
ncbi:hypothetical protein Bca101_020305 [Brassica carinata]